MRKLLAWTAVAAITTGMSGAAYAGEVTGGPHSKSTPAGDRAHSVCAFSGVEDGQTLIGFDDNDNPIVIDTDTGPGLVQTPHMENTLDIIHAPGIPGDACRGNVTSPE